MAATKKPNYTAPKELPNNRIKVDFDAYWKPNWKTRLQILIGYNLVAHSIVLVDRKGNEVRARTMFGVTQHLTPEEHAANCADQD